MIVFLREMARNRKSFIIWTICLVGANLMMMAFFPYMDTKMNAVGDMIKQFPPELVAALSMDKLNFAEILNYFAYVFQYILLFSGVFGMMFGASILSKEESEKTAEFLLSKPVKRNGVISAKALCVLVYLVIFNVIMAVADFVTFEAMTDKEYNMTAFLVMHLGQLFLQLTFAAVGLLISVFVVKSKTILPVSLSVVLGTYFISMASAISEKLENLKYLAPFEFVNPAELSAKPEFEPVYLVIMAAVIVLSTAATYLFYNKKDIAV